jgi:FlaA1/EpsC-like NDP-sugar epimerase
MRARLKKILDKIILPGWIVLFSDMTLISFVFMFTYLLRYNLVSSAVDISRMVVQLVASLPFFLLASWYFKPYRGILRYTSIKDATAVIRATTMGSAGMVLVSLMGRIFYPALVIPYSVIISQYFISIVVLIGVRFTIAYIYRNLVKRPVPDTRIMIYGAGSMGILTKNIIENDSKLNYSLVGFIDDNPGLSRKMVNGLTVYSPDEAFKKVIPQQNVKEVVIGITHPKLKKERKSEIVDLCIAHNLRIKDIPDASDWLNGRFFASQLHDVRIEDLLGRDPIILDDANVRQGVHGEQIMVTGAAGSIGSEIVRQLIPLYPRAVCLVDQSESALYDLSNEIATKNRDIKLITLVADVTDGYRMRKLFENFAPGIIFHASAYKHVPLMEEQPYEALHNNVKGTKILADLAVESGVKKFVMISTDKAVNPTNVMGASKRICEMYIQALSAREGMQTRFITTRFGNVLGSSGSVIPLFRKQISRGGPVTVTDRRIIRYFMTIPEACRLVLEAGFMGNGGEIYIFDMGKPVKIYELAEKMIRLSGLVPHQDIRIAETGLRPGEKLYEELLANREENIPTHHEKILIGKTKPTDHNRTLAMIDELVSCLTVEDEEQLVARMKEIVPEYRSLHSRFEKLDK